MRTSEPVGILLLALAAAVWAQEQPVETESLWMPEGYRLLSLEERNALPPEEMKEIGARNTTLLREAIAAMSPAERSEVGMSLSRYGQGREIPQYVRQYVAMASMMLLAAGVEEKSRADRAAIEDRYQRLLREQESTTRGFPGDQESVAKEADAIEAELELGKDRRILYLRTLRPLRARPWNDAIRICFRKIVRGDSTPRAQKTSLYDAALAFVQAREKETPEEGAWYSLEGFLRLSMRGEVADARRLFAIAVQKNARDVESRVFPILLAEVDGDAARVERLMPRAREAWPKGEDLDRVLLDNIDVLPEQLQAKAREAFGGKYKRAHPSDWSARAGILAASIDRGAFREVENETGAVLALPASILPIDARVEFRALQLRAIAGLGRCDDVVAEIPQLEAAVHEAFRGSDGENPPAPRTPQDVQELRAELQEGRRGLAKLRAAIADGSMENAPELAEVPKAERRTAAEALASEYENELARMEALLRGGVSDTAIAAEWSRRELEAWREAERMPENAFYDRADRGSRLVIQVRSAAGKCLLAHQRAAEAARILAPCVGSGANYHGDCGEPILEAGRELAKQGKWREAAAVYTVTAPIGNFSSRAEDLYREIEKAAPGTVTHFQPTPRPTPRVTITYPVQP